MHHDLCTEFIRTPNWLIALETTFAKIWSFISQVQRSEFISLWPVKAHLACHPTTFQLSTPPCLSAPLRSPWPSCPSTHQPPLWCRASALTASSAHKTSPLASSWFNPSVTSRFCLKMSPPSSFVKEHPITLCLPSIALVFFPSLIAIWHIMHRYRYTDILPWWLCGKDSTCHAGDTENSGLIPGLGRSPEGRNGNPLQYSCLENPMDRGTWLAIVHGVTESQTRLK